ncbi:MAG: tripartite tricarboxylate transporter substrate binding protein [Betaproteobacteria bacterium]|nr:tripartite tricarboxylate transporter substrate binding protein [Betaproteobacteria bacterium]
MQRRHLIQAAAFAGLPTFSYAQAWPAKPLRFVVPFPPGGTTDVVTRLIAAEVAKALGQAIVVENKPGAGTVIGVDSVAKSAPDGYSLVTVANSFCVNQTLVKKLPYDGTKDLRPVALMGMSEHVLATHPGSGIKTVADIAKAKPGTLSYASFGQGTSAHLAGEMLKTQTGADIVHVPYKGQAPALADLLGGQVSLMFGNWPEFRAHVQSGKLIALGMATAKRSVYAPSIPTLTELGVKVESNSWNGLLAPAGTPDAIVQRLNAEVNKALASPAVMEAFQKGGIASLSGSPAQFADFIQSEITRYAEVIRKANITVDS